ncbi:hypothetical protein PSHT_08296 [Puccinia striiformis]|uniref:phosphoglycerate mutase (2,3-diphosphoglycerate-dependent) n=1 Tax=Puccinia striiformis TaxID=27350 RepID=A0A2S4VR32_9BASI|nr:hypothetical protein PSHT_08296 [Puccinia striiformis]
MPMFLHSAEVAIDNVFILRSLDEIYKLSELSLSAETCAVPWAYITGAKCTLIPVGSWQNKTRRRNIFQVADITGYAERVGSVLKAVRHPGVLVSDHRVLVVGARARQALARWVSSAGSATMTMHFHHLVLISLFCLRASCGITGSPKSVLSDALDYDKLDDILTSVLVSRQNLGKPASCSCVLLHGNDKGQTHARIVVIRHGESESILVLTWMNTQISSEKSVFLSRGKVDREKDELMPPSHAIRFDCGYTSELIRAQETYGIVMNTLGHKTIPVTRDANLNALNYGILGGFVKEDAGEEFGEENVKKWYGSEDALPPGGETVKDCYQRAKSYYNDQIKRDVLAGKNIIVVAHRHPILGVLAGIEGEDHVVDPEKITNGAQVMYELDSEGRVLKRTTV